ncbi:regulatory LuxR family protein [Halopolyspora algeriensis]|uniref:Regulatory LuxR family protein n=1 Tax=Halopolyspora algeriensis TaxID=1500506 RepID=A0A368VI06_9ACTN|nr:LuxR family transcriptional regulator [Halopolyspora algeriensis]RCW40814.1 regulatory LuxR family protein [Halopolyspora algeriensis]TQM53269.1 regulatory LuxR family protein [Halopolyspora algeriensis]
MATAVSGPHEDDRAPLSETYIHTSSRTLIGRDAELHTMTELVTAPPAVLLLEGEAGVGKSRLVRELLAQPAVAVRRVLASSCRPLREPFPYGPVLEALRAVGPALKSVEPSPVTGVLCPLLPELAPYLPERPGDLGDPAAERHRLFRAVRALLAAAGPVLLVVEDLHWADEGSRDLLRFLVDAPLPNLSILLTYRREDLDGRVPLGSAYRPPENAGSAVIRLGTLGREQVGTLAAELVGQESVSAGFADKLHERTGGIPFVIEETLRALQDPAGAVRADGVTARRLLADLEVPVLLREAMAERLAALPEPAVRVVRAAAVLNVAAGTCLLGTVAGVGSSVNDALEHALRSSVLRETGDRRYGFRHALARQAVYDTLSGPQREELHARAVHALSRAEPVPLVQLAEHSRAAGRVADWLHYGEQAADHATEVGDTATATELLRALLRESAPGSDDVDRLAIKFSVAAVGGTTHHDASTELDHVLADRRLSEVARGEVRLCLGLLLLRQERALEAGRAQIELAITDLRDRPARAAVGMAVLAQAHVGTTPIAESRRWMRRAEDVIARSGNAEVVTELLGNVLPARVHLGDPPRARRHLDRLLRDPRSMTEQWHVVKLHGNLADAFGSIGHHTRAREYLASALRTVGESGGLPYLATALQCTEVRLDWLTGHWDGLAERIRGLPADYADLHPVVVELSLVLGSIAVAQGDWTEAETRLRAVGVEAPDESFAPAVTAATAARARMHLARGEPERAVADIDNGLAVTRSKGVWVWAAGLVPVAVDVYGRCGRMADAAEVLDEFTAAVRDRDAPVVGPADSACRAAMHASRGELDRAAAWWDRAAAGYRALPQFYDAALAAECAAGCRIGRDPGKAESALGAVAESFDRLGATRDAARCRHLLRRLGTRSPSNRGRRGYGNELSPREQEVTRLLERGCTNREIAEVLFLSRRTVENHTAKVLRKLGMRSRSELVARPRD